MHLLKNMRKNGKIVGNKQIKFGLIMVLFLVFGVVSCTEKGARLDEKSCYTEESCDSSEAEENLTEVHRKLFYEALCGGKVNFERCTGMFWIG